MLLKQWESLRNTKRVMRQRSRKRWQALSRNWCIHGNMNLKPQPNYHKDKMAGVTNLGVILSNLILELANFSVRWQTVHFQASLAMWSESQALHLAITVEITPEEQVWPHSTITFFRQTDSLRIGPWGPQSAEPLSNS